MKLSLTVKIGAIMNIISALVFALTIIGLVIAIPSLITNIRLLLGKTRNKTLPGVLGLLTGLIGGILVLVGKEVEQCV